MPPNGDHTLGEVSSHVTSNELLSMFYIVYSVLESLKLHIIFILRSGGPDCTDTPMISRKLAKEW